MRNKDWEAITFREDLEALKRLTRAAASRYSRRVTPSPTETASSLRRQ
jgi:hypothetical protein